MYWAPVLAGIAAIPPWQGCCHFDPNRIMVRETQAETDYAYRVAKRFGAEITTFSRRLENPTHKARVARSLISNFPDPGII
jgi:hypothetical protein